MEGVEPVELLASVGFRGARSMLRAALEELSRGRASPAETIERLVQAERQHRASANLARRTRYAALGSVPALDAFDWTYPRSADRKGFEELLTLRFLRQGTNVLLRGPSGVGKTTLSQHLGVAALSAGHQVRFTTLAGCIADLLRQESTPALHRRLRRYTTPELLIVDEVGYLPEETRGADLLYQIIQARHGKRSTVITTNLSFKQWGPMFREAGSLIPLVDRFTEDYVVLELDGDSWRQRRQRSR